MPLVFQNFATPAERMEQRVKPLFHQNGFDVTDSLSETTFRDAQFLINKSRYIDDAFVGRFSQLKAIIEFGTESWMIGLERNPIPVVSLDEDRGYEVAEHAIALALAALKQLKPFHSSQRRRSWKRMLKNVVPRQATETQGAPNWKGLITETLYQKKIGIVGYGLIGREIHRRLTGFNVSVQYCSRQKYPAQVEDELEIEFCELGAMFQECDCIFLQLPHTAETEGIISAEILRAAHAGLLLVNCGRAAVVDQGALYESLRKRRLKYYAADVFWQEPMPLWSPFRFLNNCRITPHSAESLANRQKSLLPQAIDKIKAFENASCG